MFLTALRAVRDLDDMLKEKLGKPYNAVLGIGLVIEIVARVRELHEAMATSAGAVRTIITILFFLLLLLHQVAELSDHAERRNRRLGHDS